MLTTLVLASDDDTGRYVGDTHRRLGLVHVLSARAARSIDIDAQVRRIDVDLDVLIDLGRNEDRCERRVATRVGVEGRLADQSMNARLGPKPTVGIVADDVDRRTLDAGD